MTSRISYLVLGLCLALAGCADDPAPNPVTDGGRILVDAAPVDGGRGDAGRADSGHGDAGQEDGGRTDAATADAGAPAEDASTGDADGDGVLDDDDACPSGESGWTSDPSTDVDGDGCRDATEDEDDDNDGVVDAEEVATGTDPLDPTRCGDSDSDACDDCAIGVDGYGPLPDADPAADGTDEDADGVCVVTDCDDTSSSTYPGALELCDGLDNDCSHGGGADASEDADGDFHAPLDASCTGGYPADDCDDGDGGMHPGAAELCDGLDNDCSHGGGADASEDADGDLHAPLDASCTGGYPADDCDDGDAGTHPGAAELCNGFDDDCSRGGGADVSEDADGDLHAPIGAACSGGFPADDCHDGNAGIAPGLSELPGNPADEDCNAFVDCYVDADHDGYGSSSIATDAIAAVGGVAMSGCGDSAADDYDDSSSDCDDSAAGTSPAGIETAGNGVDEDCNAFVDCYIDADHDGYGRTSVARDAIAATDGVAASGCGDSTADDYDDDRDDCHDTQAFTHPGAVEVCDGWDNDCDDTSLRFPDGSGGGDVPELDADNDQYLSCSGYTLTAVVANELYLPIRGADDCDDDDPMISPGAPENPDNGEDENCSGTDLVASAGVGVYVDLGTGCVAGGDGSPSMPFCDLGAAITAAVDEEDVFVAAGTSPPIRVDRSLRFHGGYDATRWNRDVAMNPTLIESTDPTVEAVDLRGGSRVVTALDGFIVQGASSSSTYCRVALRNETRMTLSDSEIHAGACTGMTVGVLNLGIGYLRNDAITGGSASGGSLAHSHGVHNPGALTLIGSTIDGGAADELSYGVLSSGRAILINNDIDGGEGTALSTGVRFHLPATLVGNHVFGGTSAGDSRAVWGSAGAGALINNTIDGGSAAGTSVGVYATGYLVLIGNDIWGASQDWVLHEEGTGFQTNDIGDINGCAVWNARCRPPTYGNLSVDPRFRDAERHLLPSSPLIDLGVDPRDVSDGGSIDYAAIGPTYARPFANHVMFDFEGDPRPADGLGWDIGRDEAR